MFICRLLILTQFFFPKNISGIPESISSDLDKVKRFVGPDLGQNWFQWLSADDSRR